MPSPNYSQFIGLLALFLAVLFVVGPFLGRYMRRAIEEGNYGLTAWGRPLERGLYRLAGVRADATARAELAARMARIRAHGVDNAESRPVPGIDTLAAPVFDHTGALALVIAVMGSSGSFDSRLDSDTAHVVRQAARRLSWRFGASGAAPA